MIYGWMIISERIKYSSIHDNQEYTFGKPLIGHGDGDRG
jgi:hypothetical protein